MNDLYVASVIAARNILEKVAEEGSFNVFADLSKEAEMDPGVIAPALMQETTPNEAFQYVATILKTAAYGDDDLDAIADQLIEKIAENPELAAGAAFTLVRTAEEILKAAAVEDDQDEHVAPPGAPPDSLAADNQEVDEAAENASPEEEYLHPMEAAALVEAMREAAGGNLEAEDVDTAVQPEMHTAEFLSKLAQQNPIAAESTAATAADETANQVGNDTLTLAQAVQESPVSAAAAMADLIANAIENGNIPADPEAIRNFAHAALETVMEAQESTEA